MGSHSGTGFHPSLCILELQEQLRSRTLIITTVRRIRVDENFSVDILNSNALGLTRVFKDDEVDYNR